MDYKKTFENNHLGKNIIDDKLSFEEYLNVFEQNPKLHLRNAAMYLKDVFDHFGKDKRGKFNLFTLDDIEAKPVYGQINIQNIIYKSILNFIDEGYSNRLILLTGPNGSAKSSLIKKIMKAAELYSQSEEGYIYTFSWIFPMSNLKKQIHISEKQKESESSYAYLKEEDIAAIVRSDLKDNPLLLIPLKLRRTLIIKYLGKYPKILEQVKKTYLFHGDLSKQNKQIFDALLEEYNGDILKLYRHVRVERFNISKRYSRGAVTIEPQMHIDAKMQQITIDRRYQFLPATIQSLNLFNVQGELVFANRGILEYSDLLKRPLEAYKYLLTTIETKSINVNGILTELDLLFMGTSNEIHLSAFRQHPDFKSFQGRFKIVHVPYLLDYIEEKKVYFDHLKQINNKNKFHESALDVFSLWNVISRLKEPNIENYKDKSVGELALKLNALDKALLYSQEEVIPKNLGNEEQKKIKNNIKVIKKEFFNIEEYEGKEGQSPRDSKEILNELIRKEGIITYVDILDYLEKNINQDDKNAYSRKNTYNNKKQVIEILYDYCDNIFEKQARESLDIIDELGYEGYIRKYITLISKLLSKNTGNTEVFLLGNKEEDFFIDSFEEKFNLKDENKMDFRMELVSKLGAYSLDNKNKKIIYCEVFDDLYESLKKSFVKKQRSLLLKIIDNLSYYNARDITKKRSEHIKNQEFELIESFFENLQKKFRYDHKTGQVLLERIHKKLEKDI